MHPGQNWFVNSIFATQIPSSGAVPGGDLCGVWISEKTFVPKKRDILQYHEYQKLSYGRRRKAGESEFYFEKEKY